MKAIFLVSALTLLAGTVRSQTVWPDFMPRLVSGASEFPMATAIPDDIRVEAPPNDVAGERAKWSGRWAGYACRSRMCDTKLLVAQVSGSGASIFAAMDGAWLLPFGVRAEAIFVGDEMRAILPDGTALTYRMRSDQTVEMLASRGDSNWAAGILTRTEVVQHSSPPLINPFNGIWEILAIREGKEIPWNRRVEVEGRGGVAYAGRRIKADSGQIVCGNTRTPISKVQFTTTTLSFAVAPSDALAGCESFYFYFEHRGGDVVGFYRAFGEGGKPIWAGPLHLSRP